MPHTRRGFSLIELLVALVVVAVVLGALTLNSSQSVDRELENAARRAEQLVIAACERALATGLDIGFRVSEDGLRFGYLRPTGWQPVEDDPGDELRPRALGRQLSISATRDGIALDPKANPLQAQLACFASGELTPFELRISAEDGSGWRLLGHSDGRMDLARVDPHAPH